MSSRRLLAVAALCACGAAYADSPAYWKDGGTGAFADPSHWRDGNVPKNGWVVRFDGTQDAVVDDSAMELFKSFTQVVLAGASTRLTISNDTAATIQKGKAWFVSDGILRKVGAGKLTLDHSDSATMISIYGGLEVRQGELELTTSSSVQVTPQCPIGVYSPGVLTLPANNVVKFKGLYGDGHIKNPAYADSLQFFVVNAGSRSAPYDYSGTFENYPVRYSGEDAYQRFSNPGVNIGYNLHAGYLGTYLFPGVVFRTTTEYEYLGLGEKVAADRNIFMNNSTYCLTLGGGTNGALEIAGTLLYNAENGGGLHEYVGEIVFAGDNVNPCIFSGSQTVSGNRPVYWKKTGTGTWRFTSGGTRSNSGVVATEKGRLEYDSMAEAGSASPLGSASTCLSEYYGSAVDAMLAVPYAYLLGDGTNTVDGHTATMAYIGPDAVKVTTRPVAIKGAARFESTAAVLDWTGFTSAQEGTNTLVLAGAAEGCFARDVTNGIGRLAVVKEGEGDWTVAGEYDFTGDVKVLGGTLNLDGNGYTWYRLSLMQNYTDYDKGNTGTPLGKRSDHDGNNIWLTCFGLYDGGGTNVIENLSVNSSANGNISLLEPGQAALDHSDFSQMGSGTTYQLANLFTTNATVFGGCRSIYPVNLTNESTWVRVVVRLPSGAESPVKYDIRSYGRSGWTAGLVRDVRSWKLEGSRDGASWTELHSVVSNEANIVTANYSWYSSNTLEFDTGYGISPVTSSARPASFDGVSVSGGAVLRSGSRIAVKRLMYDVALGGGMVDGLDFSQACGLEVLNMPSGAVSLPITLTNCTGLAGTRITSVTVDGKRRSGWTATLAESGIGIFPRGTVVYFR